jgi:hypothetical protein
MSHCAVQSSGLGTDARQAMEKKMRPQSLRRLALAAIVSMAAISQASADWACCSCIATCVAPGRYIPVLEVPSVAIVRPYYVRPYYIVNQGPDYSGPGIVTYPAYAAVVRPWEVYPFNTDHYIGQYRGWYGGGRRYVRPVRMYR